MTKERSQKVGIYVDVANITRSGGYGMKFDVLRDFACRDSGEPVRLNAYVAYDEDRAKIDSDYKERTFNFHSALRDFGFKVIEKKVSWYIDESGTKYGKANADLDMAVDALLQSENLDKVMLVTGDGDFVQVVKALQNKGCRVEAVAFQNVSQLLKREVDLFVSGYLIPNLLPIDNADRKPWGELGAKVRGICYTYNHSKNYGFMRYIKRIGPGLWITDTRRDDSPYETVFVHESALPQNVQVTNLPNRDYIFEFDVTKGEKGLQATNVVRVYPT
ncbi:MAG: NYN domain-containing protein [Deltaproteobacteria bacterium]|nr:NYN domain-containing protein [Deltaproteobacteria bacterium]